jgi:hypothetical protein
MRGSPTGSPGSPEGAGGGAEGEGEGAATAPPTAPTATEERFRGKIQDWLCKKPAVRMGILQVRCLALCSVL